MTLTRFDRTLWESIILNDGDHLFFRATRLCFLELINREYFLALLLDSLTINLVALWYNISRTTRSVL